ncbi:hypothetical protein EQG41_01575 [Billgrantia azerbaijanica]|nr:hypothetical protein EQG41_01575 [Halomonas azerbaijanica]
MSQHEPLRRPQTVADRPRPAPRLEFYLPAMPPLGLINAIEHRWAAYRRRRRFRQRFLPLLALDDRTLEDIGHRRDDLLWASRLPLRENAHEALIARRAQRRAEGSPRRLP